MSCLFCTLCKDFCCQVHFLASVTLGTAKPQEQLQAGQLLLAGSPDLPGQGGQGEAAPPPPPHHVACCSCSHLSKSGTNQCDEGSKQSICFSSSARFKWGRMRLECALLLRLVG